MNNKLKSTLALFLCLLMAASSLAGCNGGSAAGDGGSATNNGDGTVSGENPYKQATYNTTTTTMPSNWNEFTYADNNDTQIMSYIGSSFFEYDYKFEDGNKFNEDGTINTDAIVPGAYTVNYSAATKLEDVTSTVDA